MFDTPTYYSATILDPRMKIKSFSGAHSAAVTTGSISTMQFYAADHFFDNVPPPPENDIELEIFGTSEGPRISVEEECRRYLNEPAVAYQLNPIAYWESKASQFPTLYRAARLYLAAPASSTPSERAFSFGRLVITDQRGLRTLPPSAVKCA